MARRPEGMNDKMYRPEYDGPKVPPKGEGIPMTKPPRPGRPTPVTQLRPMKPGLPPRGRPVDELPGLVTTMPVGRPMVSKPSGLSEEAKKAALEMIRKRSGK